jgi:hypothetical protein
VAYGALVAAAREIKEQGTFDATRDRSVISSKDLANIFKKWT